MSTFVMGPLQTLALYPALFATAWLAAPVFAQSAALHSLKVYLVGTLGVEPQAVPFAVLFALIVLAHAVSPIVAYLLQLRERGYLTPENPRLSREQLSGHRVAARAMAAHYNLLEGVAAFASAVIVAHARKVDLSVRIAMSLLHVAARVAHWLSYLLNVPLARTVAYHVGLAAITVLFGLAVAPAPWARGVYGEWAAVGGKSVGWVAAKIAGAMS
ncbi:hypothetical protein H9P43_009795 [Blastocladiella emersonii ATCC 22665]|nr:hypothetical protein H9P43_009795 [Blastocladiella emersonii ATCC 22665]